MILLESRFLWVLHVPHRGQSTPLGVVSPALRPIGVIDIWEPSE
jgi:hypothetical protein